jgi:hypothetical protein
MGERVRKPGFVYIYSEALKQEIAMSEKTGRVYCEDKVQYSPQEIAIMNAAGVEIDLNTHLVKKVFEGEVVKVEGLGTKSQGKSDESGCGNGASDNSSAVETAPSANGISAADGNGELGIY